MTEGNSKEMVCARAESVAAYLDGEMDAGSVVAFESHLKECAACSGALREQRRLLCLLDTAFNPHAAERVELPKDFARVVTARAQNDMGGVRSARERAFSAKLSLLLAALAALLIGASAMNDVLAPLSALGRALASVAGLLGHALADAGRGAIVILRPLGGRLVAGPSSLTVFYWLLFVGALFLLLRLIRRYHRAQ